MNKAYKLIKRKVKVSPNIRKTIDLNAEVYSQDIDVTKIVLVLEDDNGEKIDLTDADVRVALQFNNVVIEDRGKVESVEEQSISYSPGERFKYQEGLVTIAFYVTLSTNQRIDISHFKINFKRSLIDSQHAAEELETQFISVNEFIEKEKKSYEKSRLGFNSIVDHAMDEIVEKKKEFDLKMQELLTSGYTELLSDAQNRMAALEEKLGSAIGDNVSVKRPPYGYRLNRKADPWELIFDNGCILTFQYYYGLYGWDEWDENPIDINTRPNKVYAYSPPEVIMQHVKGHYTVDKIKEAPASNYNEFINCELKNPINDSSLYNFDEAFGDASDDTLIGKRNFLKLLYELDALIEDDLLSVGVINAHLNWD